MNRGLQFAFAAYGLAFAVIFIFMLLMISRQSRLEKKLEQLRELVKDRHR